MSACPEASATAELPVWDCAVSLAFLQEFSRSVPSDVTVTSVTYDIIKPATLSRQCRYIDLLDRRQYSTANYFISHRWSNTLSYLVDTVSRHLSGAMPDEVFVWVDIFAINQHRPTEDLKGLKTTIEVAEQVLVVMDPQALLLTRVWCL